MQVWVGFLRPFVGDRGRDATPVRFSGSPRESSDARSSAVAVGKAGGTDAILGVRPGQTSSISITPTSSWVGCGVVERSKGEVRSSVGGSMGDAPLPRCEVAGVGPAGQLRARACMCHSTQQKCNSRNTLKNGPKPHPACLLCDEQLGVKVRASEWVLRARPRRRKDGPEVGQAQR
jgi:hypothetical protein